MFQDVCREERSCCNKRSNLRKDDCKGKILVMWNSKQKSQCWRIIWWWEVVSSPRHNMQRCRDIYVRTSALILLTHDGYRNRKKKSRECYHADHTWSRQRLLRSKHVEWRIGPSVKVGVKPICDDHDDAADPNNQGGKDYVLR